MVVSNHADANFARPAISFKRQGIKHGNETVKIFQTLNCNSRNLIYLIHCESCGAQYEGETGSRLREIFYGHRADVRLGKRTDVAVHFDGRLCNFEQHCKLYPIEEIPDTLLQEANKVASHSIRSLFTQLKETLLFKSNQELIRKTSLYPVHLGRF